MQLEMGERTPYGEPALVLPGLSGGGAGQSTRGRVRSPFSLCELHRSGSEWKLHVRPPLRIRIETSGMHPLLDVRRPGNAGRILRPGQAVRIACGTVTSGQSLQMAAQKKLPGRHRAKRIPHYDAIIRLAIIQVFTRDLGATLMHRSRKSRPLPVKLRPRSTPVPPAVSPRRWNRMRRRGCSCRESA